MIDHNTRRVLLSFLIIVFLNFDPCFRNVISDSSEGDTMTIFLVIYYYYYYYKEYYSCILFLPYCSCFGQVTGDNLEEAIVTVARGNILDETWNRLSRLYT
jgi:hypothetical protein